MDTADEVCTILKTLSQRYNDNLIEATVEARRDGEMIVLVAEGMYNPCYSLSAVAPVPGRIC